MISFPVIENTKATLKNWSIKLSKLNQRVQSIVNLLEWNTWDVVLSASGAMTISNVSKESFWFFRIGKTVFFSATATFTTGGTASPTIRGALPYPAENEPLDYSFSSLVVDSAGGIGGISTLSANRDGFHVSRYDGANWSLGSNRLFRITGFYRAKIN